MPADVTLIEVVAVSIAAFVVGLSKGGLPGLGPMTTVIVALAVPATTAIGVVLPLLMVGDMVALVALRRHIDFSIARPVIAGAAVGVALASLTLSSLSPEALEWAIVVVLVVFVAYRAAILTGLGRPESGGERSILAGGRAGAVAGVATGITSTVAHAGGPPVAIHLLARRVPPIVYAGTSAAIFWAVNWMKVPGYALAGLIDPPLLVTLAPTALLIPPGVLIGRWAALRLAPKPFEVLVLVGLLVGAVLLVVT